MNRRKFLTWGTGGLVALWAAAGAALAAMLRFLSPSVYYEPPQSFKIGDPGDFPLGSPTFLPDEKIYVFRDQEKGFAVASAVCTHLGCTVQWFNNDDKFHCPCHGSVFAANGKVLHGPAPRPLEWFEVTLTKDGQLRVDKDHVVNAAYHLVVKA
jgi:cytochrome b6-f complex iron-sulfur subunit